MLLYCAEQEAAEAQTGIEVTSDKQQAVESLQISLNVKWMGF